MVRVIETELPRGDAIEEKAQRRKEIVQKIAVRTNQQNPIKPWDLAANDDFQLELFRFFRSKSYFYERRDREWGQRSRELKNAKIEYGNTIKKLAQLIASFYWSKPKLGPAVAKNSVADLFVGPAYEKIRDTRPELAFQINLLGWNIRECERDLANEKAYVRNMKSGNLAVFALAVRALQEVGAEFGDPAFTEQLHAQWDDWTAPYRLWKELTKACIDSIRASFKKQAARYSSDSGDELTYANYFKGQGYMTGLMGASLGGEIKRCARAVQKSLA
jgi:hypothetical protein